MIATSQRARQRARTSASSRSAWSGEISGDGQVFQLTAYEWTGNRTASGAWPQEGVTVASNYFPIGTRLYIDGIGERVVQDTGGMANSVIDIYLGDPSACIQFGRQNATVHVIEDE